jgi:asparagine synthase (glutamine-hydrolysing)
MCGIAGVRTAAGAAPSADAVRQMVEALRHRGPDDDGWWSEGRVAFGFRRLAVIDLETGQQPIALEDGSGVLVLNGEIYNFRELRAELEARGARFRSRGDVEVAARLLAMDGLAAIARLDGMFALAWYDRRRDVLALARDRFGIKPLFVCREGTSVAFASEERALMAGGFPGRRSIDPVGLRHVLAYGYPPPDRTALAGVRQVPPAAVVEIDADGEEREWTYWDPPETASRGVSFRDARERVRTALDASVTAQLVADVPVGVFLSGGVDSSTVAAFAAERVSGPLRTFSVGFEGPDAVSELPAARRVAQALGSDHAELVMDPVAIADDLETILDDLDGPLADPTAIPTWYLSRLARVRATVALSGEGADEIFGGYARQRYDAALDGLGGLGRRALPAVMAASGRPVSSRLRRRLRMGPGLARQLDWGRVLSSELIDRLGTAPFATDEAMHAVHARLAERWSRIARRDPVQARMTTDREVFLPADLLPKVDRMSMAHSLEVRVPFLGDAVVDLVLPLPGRFKATLFADKRLLRAAVAPLLPEGVAGRRKQGFDVPIGAWLRGPLREVTGDLLSPASTGPTGLFDADAVAGILGAHLDGSADHGRELWTLLVVATWARRAGVEA